jgi:Phospholipid methyltransferase
MPFGVAYPGAMAFVLGIVLMAWVLRVNPFAEATVRIQKDRGQTVVISGPYRFVRHPMYIGAFLMYLGMPLVLGSVGALTLGAAIVALMIWRTSHFGPELGLPKAIGGHHSYWLWGPRGYTGESVIFLDPWPEMLGHCASVTLVGKPDTPFARPDEHPAIYHCRGLDFDISKHWEIFRHYD